MIGIRLRQGHHLVDVEPDANGIIEVVGETQPDFATPRDTELWFIGHLRTTHPELSDEEFRASLARSEPPWNQYADLSTWPDPDQQRHAITLTEAEELIESGWADPVLPDADQIDATLARWTSNNEE